MFDTFKMILMNYREAVYLIFAFGATWGACLMIGVRMAIEEIKYERKSKNK